MVLILPEHSQRPYRYGMTLLCIGAMFNWLGLADNNAEPVRYIGVTLIAAGAMLVCLAMCFWMKATHDPEVAAMQAEQDTLHHIAAIHAQAHRAGNGGESAVVAEKPPDYETVTGALPPSYEEAVKISPAATNSDADCLKAEGEQPRNGSSGCFVAVGETLSASPADKPDSSTNGENNFGSKMLRISRRLLRGMRGQSGEESDATRAQQQTSPSADTPDVTVVL